MIERQYKPIYDRQEVLNENNLTIKLQKSKQNTEHLISYLDETIIKVESISAPVHKKTTQRDLTSVLQRFRNLQMQLLQAHTTLNEIEIRIILSKIEDHKKVMDNFLENFLLSEN